MRHEIGRDSHDGEWNVKKLMSVGVVVFLLLVGAGMLGMVFEKIDADEILVIQDPLDGELHFYTDAGVKWQGFGKTTVYPKRAMYTFTCTEYKDREQDAQQKATGSASHRECVGEDTRIKIRFNEGGHGLINGSIQFDMPLDAENLTKIQSKFGSEEAIVRQLIHTVVDKSIYMSGPHMSSRESFAEKRTDLVRIVEDQIENGIYATLQREAKVKDSITGVDKTVTQVEIVMKDGKPQRQEAAQLTAFGIRPFNFTIKSLDYYEDVERQIQQQQQLNMEVQISIAEAKKAEQRAITVAEQGKANAAQAKWEQEVIKAKAVTEAEQKLEVARLDAQAAEQFKRAEILRGEGEGTRKRLVMQADGGLEAKLATILEINKAYADAIKEYKGNWVPQVVMGGELGRTPGGAANDLIELLKVKAARDIAVDTTVAGREQTRPKQ